MTIVDGRKIAQAIAGEVAAQISLLTEVPKLTVIACDPNFETQKYLGMKKAKAESLGIELSVLVLPKESDTELLVETVKKSSQMATGIVVQLPLPAHIDTAAVLAAIPVTHDVDAFYYQGNDSFILPPVVGAIDEISKRHNVTWLDKQVVVFGQGRLVGNPIIQYAKNQGAVVTVITEESKNVNDLTKTADIIVLGVGKPNLLTAEMVKEGVIVFDAGASEDGGLLVGDASPAVAEKAALFTPVPGGIGPITIVLLFRNLLKLRVRQ